MVYSKFSFLLLGILFFGCSQSKQMGLYDNEMVDSNPGLNGFKATSIYSDAFTADIWFTQEATCITVNSDVQDSYKGNQSIHIKWNKQAGGCPWLGLGIGWDGWTGKDISAIQKDAAIVFYLKSNTGIMKAIPWAMGFEDFAGEQAWTGVFNSAIEGGIIKEGWTKITIPLENFPFESHDVDVTSIKQLIIQFESSGDVLIDELHLESYKSKGKQSIELQTNTTPVIDGVLAPGEWKNSFLIGNSSVTIYADENNLYISGEIKDESPLINKQSGKDIWNGDAVEIAFTSRPNANTKRIFFYEDDRHIGIKMTAQPEAFDWSRQKVVACNCSTSLNGSGVYQFECALPFANLDAIPMSAGNSYGIEIAIDHGGSNGDREIQERWNSKDREGFNTNPSLWGTLNFETNQEP